jgi:hypothetical protein
MGRDKQATEKDINDAALQEEQPKVARGHGHYLANREAPSYWKFKTWERIEEPQRRISMTLFYRKSD